jgi:hypothetical protein
MIFIQPSIVNNDRSMNDVQTDMDARYKISGKAREFADGPGVLPPADAIPLPDKAGSTYTGTVIQPAPTPVKKKVTFGGSHRR